MISQKNLLLKQPLSQNFDQVTADNNTNNNNAMTQLFNENIDFSSIPPMILAQLYVAANDDEESVKKFLQQIGFGRQIMVPEEETPNGLDLTGGQTLSRKRRRSGDSNSSNSEISPSKATTAFFTGIKAQDLQNHRLPSLHLRPSFGNPCNLSFSNTTIKILF